MILPSGFRGPGFWRSDVPLIQDQIQPAFAEIWNQLDRIDAQLEGDAEQTVLVDRQPPPTRKGESGGEPKYLDTTLPVACPF
mgnify:CR=1 FL=1